MPIYEYSCTSCSESVEVIQKISDEPLKECPSCKKATLIKQTSMTSFQLKGGGWYSDGYGASKPDSKKKESSTPAKKDAPKKDAKSTTPKTSSGQKAS